MVEDEDQNDRVKRISEKNILDITIDDIKMLRISGYVVEADQLLESFRNNKRKNLEQERKELLQNLKRKQYLKNKNIEKRTRKINFGE